MPIFLLLALFVAFGFDTSDGRRSMALPELAAKLGTTAVCVLVIGLAARAAALIIQRGVRRSRSGDAAVRRLHTAAVRGFELASLIAFSWTIHGAADWPGVVRGGLRLRGTLVLDDALIVTPYILMQLAIWWGLYPAERALRLGGDWDDPHIGLARYLWRQARRALGLVLPAALVFSVGQGAVRRLFPTFWNEPWAQPVTIAALGVVVLMLSPAFVRLAWPTTPLPPGSLRTRLERLCRRHGFRCTDILVWDTGHVLVNAGVTGAVPWFRYVLLTDGLIESLDEHQIAAVFGHEIGHIAHRHLLYFGFFFLASLGLMALFERAVTDALAWLPPYLDGLLAGDGLLSSVETVAALALVGLYFLLVFGFLSRRLERQADVFGCRAVSCGGAACPPHVDPYAVDVATSTARPALCPVGIRIFVNALRNVAELNGLETDRRSWRHGSIGRRIAFLETLVDRPDAERRFQAGTARLRLGVALVLIACFVAAVSSGSFDGRR